MSEDKLKTFFSLNEGLIICCLDSKQHLCAKNAFYSTKGSVNVLLM